MVARNITSFWFESWGWLHLVANDSFVPIYLEFHQLVFFPVLQRMLFINRRILNSFFSTLRAAFTVQDVLRVYKSLHALRMENILGIFTPIEMDIVSCVFLCCFYFILIPVLLNAWEYLCCCLKTIITIKIFL